jgi:hypothetical protein
MTLEFPLEIFEKYSDIKFHEKSFQWEQSCSMRTDRRTDMTQLKIAFRNFMNAPKKLFVHLFLLTLKISPFKIDPNMNCPYRLCEASIE